MTEMVELLAMNCLEQRVKTPVSGPSGGLDCLVHCAGDKCESKHPDLG